jgi:hypothetical protein
MPIRSFIKIHGPPLLKALEALDNIPINTSEIPARVIGFTLGEYDYCYEWLRGQPDTKDFLKLIEKIDEALTPLGVKYTITTLVRW